MAKKSKKKMAVPKVSGGGGDEWLSVDPERVRFQHARIRPYFSGCGRSVVETLESIRREELKPEDLPPIQVISGPDDPENGERWYFSLNNRRLWVLKRCREEGLLANNQIRVRVRSAKSSSETERYTLDNCAVEAKFIRERDPNEPASVNSKPANLSRSNDVENELEQEGRMSPPIETEPFFQQKKEMDDEVEDDYSSDDDVQASNRRNPFATALGSDSDEESD